jgi:hypothetical protein
MTNPIENMDASYYEYLLPEELPSKEFLCAIAPICAKIEGLINIYDSDKFVTGRSLLNDYKVLLEYLADAPADESYLAKCAR